MYVYICVYIYDNYCIIIAHLHPDILHALSLHGLSASFPRALLDSISRDCPHCVQGVSACAPHRVQRINQVSKETYYSVKRDLLPVPRVASSGSTKATSLTRSRVSLSLSLSLQGAGSFR